MARRPLFSVVIPTRNRAALLQSALCTVLDQTFDDFEVVVSDNCSADETRSVAHDVADRRVRYVRTNTPLSMADSWEFASMHARGRFVTYLSDDDGLHPRLLERVANVLRDAAVSTVTWYWAHYLHPDWRQVEHRNTLIVRHFTGRAIELDARATVARFFAGDYWIDPLPRLLNSATHRDLIDRVRASVSRFLWPWSPDYAAAIAILGQGGPYVHIDEPLMLAGCSDASIGRAAMHGGSLSYTEFLHSFDEAQWGWYVPIRVPFVANNIVDTALRVRDRLKLHEIEVDWVAYYVACYGDLASLARRGVDVKLAQDAFDAALAAEPSDVRAAVQRRIDTLESPPRLGVRAALRALITRSRLLSDLEARLRPSIRSARALLVSGAEGNFCNILECARRLPALLANGYRASPHGRFGNLEF